MRLLDKIRSMVGATDEYEEDFNEEVMRKNEEPSSDNNSGRVVNIKAPARVRVVIIKPERFQDSSSIVDCLKDNKTVVLNLESTDKESSRRIIDFSSGAAYANNGQIKCIANRTFIITP